jgi:hypothetical membrane protein
MLRTNNIVIGLIFTLFSAQFLLVLMLGAAIAPAYSIHDNAISDLGVIPQTALLFNTSLFFFGLFMIIAAYFYHHEHNKLWITILFIISGVGAIGVALFPENNPGIHAIFAFIAFVFANIIPIGISTILPKPLKILSIATGILGMIFLIIFMISDINILNLDSLIGYGGWERMIVYPVLLWLVAFGGYCMASSSKE